MTVQWCMIPRLPLPLVQSTLTAEKPRADTSGPLVCPVLGAGNSVPRRPHLSQVTMPWRWKRGWETGSQLSCTFSCPSWQMAWATAQPGTWQVAATTVRDVWSSWTGGTLAVQGLTEACTMIARQWVRVECCVVTITMKTIPRQPQQSPKFKSAKSAKRLGLETPSPLVQISSPRETQHPIKLMVTEARPRRESPRAISKTDTWRSTAAASRPRHGTTVSGFPSHRNPSARSRHSAPRPKRSPSGLPGTGELPTVRSAHRCISSLNFPVRSWRNRSKTFPPWCLWITPRLTRHCKYARISNFSVIEDWWLFGWTCRAGSAETAGCRFAIQPLWVIGFSFILQSCKGSMTRSYTPESDIPLIRLDYPKAFFFTRATGS